MKKNKFIGIFFIAIMSLLFSCQEEKLDKNDFRNKSLPVEINITCSEVDDISAEVAEVHNVIINDFMKTMYKQGDVFDETYLDNIYAFTLKELGSMELKYIDVKYLQKPNFQDIINGIQIDDIQTFLDRASFEVNCDKELVASQCNDIQNHFEELFYKFAEDKEYSIDNVRADYQDYVRQTIAGNNINDYLCVKVFSDMYLSSFQTWFIYFNPANNTKGLSEYWNSAKAAAKQFYHDAKPVAKADAAGAALGALGGVAVGGVGAGPGAIGGGALTSMGKILGI